MLMDGHCVQPSQWALSNGSRLSCGGCGALDKPCPGNGWPLPQAATEWETG